MRIVPQLIASLFIAILLSGCGAGTTPSAPLTLEGKVETQGHSGAPVVVLTKTNRIQEILNGGDGLVALISPQTDGRFELDLEEKGLTAGSVVYLSAFIPSDRENPYIPAKGDPMGIYTHPQTHQPGITLQEGANKGFSILLTRTMNETEAKVPCTLATGKKPIMLLAHQGPIASNDMSEINPDNIIGYSEIDKAATPPFTLDILPFAPEPPIDNVVVAAIWDENENGAMDSGDRLGLAMENGKPIGVRITGGENPEVAISPVMTLPKANPENLMVSGRITNAQGVTGPIWIVAGKGDNPAALMEAPFENALAFQRLTSPDFQMDLGISGASAGDTIHLVCLVQNSSPATPFPVPVSGDTLGWFQKPGALSAGIALTEEGIQDLNFTATRTLHEGSCRLSGTLPDHDKPVIVVAHRGEPQSTRFSELEMDRIMGMVKVPPSETTFSLNAMALGATFPLSSVYLMAMEDTDENGAISAGDRVAIALENGTPRPMDLQKGVPVENIGLTFALSVPTPSGPDASISGTLAVRELAENQTSWLVVAKGDDPGVLTSDPMGNMVWFEKLSAETIASGQFSLSLAQMAVSPGDKIMVLGVTKKSGKGFPMPNTGDAVGIAIAQGSLSAAITVTEQGKSGLSLNLNRVVYDVSARVSGIVQDLTLVKHHNGPTVVLLHRTYTSDPASIDPAQALGFARFEKESREASYTIDLLPYFDVDPTDGQGQVSVNVWAYAHVDKNRNGMADSGDAAGRSSQITITDGSNQSRTISVVGM